MSKIIVIIRKYVRNEYSVESMKLELSFLSVGSRSDFNVQY